MNRIKLNKRGFSMVEVVIALTVIVIVSITALTLVDSAITANAATVGKIKGQNFAENAWQCFKISESAEEFEKYLAFAEDDVEQRVGENAGENIDEKKGYVYYSARHKFTAYISVAFTDNGDTFEIRVYEGDADEVIHFSYNK